MKSNNALIITWIGEPATENVVKNVAEYLVNCKLTMPELITVIQKDEDAIATALLRSSEITEEPATDAKTSAVILIGKRFDDTLISTNGDYVPFTMALLHAIAEAKKKHTEEGVALINAVEIIAKMDKAPKIARMYHMTDKAINVIRQIYNNTWIRA